MDEFFDTVVYVVAVGGNQLGVALRGIGKQLRNRQFYFAMKAEFLRLAMYLLRVPWRPSMSMTATLKPSCIKLMARCMEIVDLPVPPFSLLTTIIWAFLLKFFVHFVIWQPKLESLHLRRRNRR